MGDDIDNNFTPRRWAELEEAVASRTQDMSKLELIGKPLLSDDESSEQTDSEGEIIDSECESEEDEQQTASEPSSDDESNEVMDLSDSIKKSPLCK